MSSLAGRRWRVGLDFQTLKINNNNNNNIRILLILYPSIFGQRCKIFNYLGSSYWDFKKLMRLMLYFIYFYSSPLIYVNGWLKIYPKINLKLKRIINQKQIIVDNFFNKNLINRKFYLYLCVFSFNYQHDYPTINYRARFSLLFFWNNWRNVINSFGYRTIKWFNFQF